MATANEAIAIATARIAAGTTARRKTDKMRIGLTGGIGAGKSTVTNYLVEKGYKVIDCDRVAREVVEPGAPALAALCEAFGDDILDESGALDREKTAKIVFSDPEKRKTLDGITHAAIYDIIEERSKGHEGSLVFIDAALIFESGLDRELDSVWVVTADDDIRRKRVAIRDNMDEEMIANRMKSQMSEDERKERADEVIDNSGAIEDLHVQIERLLEKYEQ